MSTKERYKRNSDRVYEIYGVPPKSRGTEYNIHHIIQKSDLKKHPEIVGNYDINQVANLIPLQRIEHDRLHQMIAVNEPQDQIKRRKRKHHR